MVLFQIIPDLVQVDNPVSPRDYLGRFWVDSLVHDATSFKFLADLIGKDKICLGSDSLMHRSISLIARSTSCNGTVPIPINELGCAATVAAI